MTVLLHRLNLLLLLFFFPELLTSGKEGNCSVENISLSIRDKYFELSPDKEKKETVVLVDLTRPLTKVETQHVKVPTPGLFEDRTSFKLDLNNLDSCAWCYPLPEGKVISHFGGSRKNHSGTDIKAPRGEKILAVFDGVVRFSGTYSAYGKMIVIRHANGLETCYAHNKQNLVKVGDVVQAGDPIALVGRTGRASTDHCHFEVRVNGYAINSNHLFDHSAHSLEKGILVFKKSGHRVLVKKH